MATSNEIIDAKTPSEALYYFMRDTGVPDYWYLFERSWFFRSPDLQALVVRVVMLGRAKEINVVARDFREHIAALLLNNTEVD